MITQRRMKDLGTFKTGLTYSPNDLTSIGEGVLVLRSSNIQEGKIVFDDNVYVNCALSDEQKVKKDDILICSRNGSAKLVGKSAIIPDNIDASWGAFMMLFRSYGSNSRYLNYLFSSQIENYKGMFSTSTINQLTNAMLGNMFVVYEDDASKQQAIANYLDKKTTEIDKQVELLDQKQKAYQKLKASLINQVVTRGLNPNVPLRDSEIDWIGEIPSHWEVKRLKDVTSFINGYAFDSNDFETEDGVRVIRIGDIGQRVDFDNCARTKTDKAILSTFKIIDGDILLAMSGATTGKCCIVENPQEAYINQRVGIIRSEMGKIIYYLMQTPYFMDFVNLRNTGSAQPNISSKDIGEFPIIVVPLEERNSITDYLDEKTAEIDEQISNIDKKNNIYKRLKQSLIDEVVTGKRKI